jgi:hypothetical protein
MTTLPGTEEVKLVSIRAVVNVHRAAEFVVPRHEVLVVHGAYGTGKATAVHAYLDHQPLPVTWLDMLPNQSARDLVRRLHDQVLNPEILSERDRQDDLVEALQQDRIVVVRHAHRLSSEAAGMLQWLHARPAHAWTMVLVGGPPTGKAIALDPLLRGAVASTVEVKPLNGRELMDALQSMHPLLLGAGTELLSEIDSRVCHGLLGHWGRFLQHAIHLRDVITALRGDPPVLDRDLAKAVLADMPTTTHKVH